MTLTDFLLARIGEDEVWAKRGRLPSDWRPDDPARVLAECEAKRRIVARACVQEGQWLPGADTMRFTLWDLALPYADHPDYREEWRP